MDAGSSGRILPTFLRSVITDRHWTSLVRRLKAPSRSVVLNFLFISGTLTLTACPSVIEFQPDPIPAQCDKYGDTMTLSNSSVLANMCVAADSSGVRGVSPDETSYCRATSDVDDSPVQQFDLEYFSTTTKHLITIAANYECCADIFEDAVLEKMLPEIDVAEDAVSTHLHQAHIGGTQFCNFDTHVVPYTDIEELSRFQKLFLAAYDSVTRWRTCNEIKVDAWSSSPRTNVLALYDEETRSISISEKLCSSESIYNFDVSSISNIAMTYIVSGHEIGHAMDHAAGTIHTRTRREREHFANVVGLAIGQCIYRTKAELSRHIRSYMPPDGGHRLECVKKADQAWEREFERVLSTYLERNSQRLQSPQLDGLNYCVEQDGYHLLTGGS